MIPQQETKFCYRCNRTVEAELVRNTASNGAVQVWQRCKRCNNNVRRGGAFVPHRELGIEIEFIPIVNDYRDPAQKCEFYGCEEIGTEMHHWAPRHLFIFDADKWPVSYLCKYHHKIWHDTVTPEMREVKHA